jgi:hypothetical protein
LWGFRVYNPSTGGSGGGPTQAVQKLLIVDQGKSDLCESAVIINNLQSEGEALTIYWAIALLFHSFSVTLRSKIQGYFVPVSKLKVN